MAIASKEDLDKKILEQDGEIAALKARDAEVEKIKAEQEAAKKAVAEMKEQMAEVATKNWVEKYSTQNTKEETLYNFGNYIKGVIRHDPELLNKYGKGGRYLSTDQSKSWDRVEKSDLGTPIYSDAATGSYVVPVEYAAEVMYVAKQASQMMGQVREIPMSAVTKYVPTGDTMATMKWQALQSSAKSETNPTFSRATLTAYTGAMWTGVSDELLEDSLVPLAAYFRDIFGQEAAYQFDYQSTASNADPFTGILHAASNAKVLGAGQTAFADIGFDDLYDTVAELTTANKRVGAKWIMHTTIFDILRKVKDANGNYLYQAPAAGQPGTLCGYPYILTDGMVAASDSAASTKFIAFGNPQHFLWGNRMGLEFKVFDQTSHAVEYDEILFRARVRWGFAVAIANAFVSVATAAS